MQEQEHQHEQDQSGKSQAGAGEEPARSHQVVWPRNVAPALRATPRMPPKLAADSGISGRDLRVLRWAGEQYAARIDHVQALIPGSIQNTRRVARKLRAAELAQARVILADQPMWIIPTAAGLAACQLPYKEWAFTLARVEHISAINDARLLIQSRTPQAEWIPERQLWFEHGAERFRDHPGAAGLPDGLVLLEGRTMAVQVELALKSKRRLETILNGLVRRYDSVLYFCARDPLRVLTELQKTGRWPTVGVRDLAPPPPSAERER